MTYLLLKALHLASAMVFMSGLVLLALAAAGGSVVLQAAGGHVLSWDRRVTVPALAATWALGLGLASWGHWMGAGWLQAKLVLVVALSAVHGMLRALLRRQLDGGPGGPASWTRWMPAAVLFSGTAIVLLVILKP